MDNRRLVVLYGDSLLMDTVEASLGDHQELGVMRIHTTVANVAERLASIKPDAVIFDWDANHAAFVLPFLREQPGIPLLGLDVTCSKVVALCSEQYQALTANDLANLVLAYTSLKDGMAQPPLGGGLEQGAPEALH